MSQPNYIIVPEFCTVLLVLHFVTDQPNLNLTQLQVGLTFFTAQPNLNLTQIRAGLVLLVLHFVTDQPNLNLTQLQVVLLLPSGVVH